jgi:hypothetical protein
VRCNLVLLNRYGGQVQANSNPGKGYDADLSSPPTGIRDPRGVFCLSIRAKYKPARTVAEDLTAKSVYFDNQTDVPAVGEKALERLKKWGRFRIVNDKKQAGFILQLSASPYNGGHLLLADGQTATIHHDGDVEVDPVPTYNKAAPVRVAYLTAIDPTTGERLWSDSHVWGGLLTGFNSAGERLMNVFRKQLKK